MGTGEILSIVLKSIYLFDYLKGKGIISFTFIVIVFLFALLLLVWLVYLTVKTIFMKKNITAMGTVLNEEGEVTEILDEGGKKGWISIYGENWKFVSKEPVKVRDRVKVIKHKKMDLIVEKIKTPSDFL